MSLAAVQEVNKAQIKSEEMISEHVKKARSLIADAEAQGTALLLEIRKKSADEASGLMSDADNAASDDEKAILAKAEKACADLRASAQERIADASEKLVGRIVNG